MWRGTLSSRLRSKRAPSRRGLAACLVAAGTLLGTVALATPSSAAQQGAGARRPELLHGSAAPRVPAGTSRTGMLAASQVLNVDVTLGLNNQAELTALLRGLASPASPYYHDFLTPAQFDAAFGPTPQQADAVESALRADGLTPGPASQDRLSIPVTATAAQLQHAFGITLATYRLPGGRAAYANTVAPAIQQDVAPYVTGIVGLNDLYPAHSAARPVAAAAATRGSAATTSTASTTSVAAAGPTACRSGTSTVYGAGYPLSKLAGYYGLSWLYGLGDEGQGSRIALLELEPAQTSDIAAFEKCYGITTKVSYDQVYGSFPKGAASSSQEAPLDIEIAAALAPRAAIDVLQSTNTSKGFYDVIQRFVQGTNKTLDKTLSISWGWCENENTDLAPIEALIEEADAQGQTVVAAAGDDGATDCFDEGPDGVIDPNSTLSVNFPASSPYAVSVGGTTTTLTGNDEVVWNDSETNPPEGAGGGGISISCMPGYQDQTAIPGIINPADTTDVDSSASCPTGHYRQVPDVSADADPLTGYIVYVKGQGGWVPFGGTSAATPLWAAIAALTDASPFCAGYGSGSAGLLPQALYAAVAQSTSYIYGATSVPEVLRDVISGTNDYTPSGDYSGDYSAGPGFDLASGLGTPVVPGYRGGRPSTYNPGLTALMCRQLATRHLKIAGIAARARRTRRCGSRCTRRGCCPWRGPTWSRCTPGPRCWPRPPRRALSPPAR